MTQRDGYFTFYCSLLSEVEGSCDPGELLARRYMLNSISGSLDCHECGEVVRAVSATNTFLLASPETLQGLFRFGTPSPKTFYFAVPSMGNFDTSRFISVSAIFRRRS